MTDGADDFDWDCVLQSWQNRKPDAVLIAGPTASGKSALALALAQRLGGAIVNADSMQVYPVLQVLTARPDAAEEARAPHYLYGHAAIDEPYSVARWVEDARAVPAEIRSEGLVPIFVGGTGLYFRALEQGLSPIPAVPQHIRDTVRRQLREEGAAALHRVLAEVDPEGAARLEPGDGQRIARALEVVRAHNRPLHTFQSGGGDAVISGDLARFVITPDRAVLRSRIAERADRMLEEGSVQEVRALLALNLPGEATVLKAIGVEPLAAFIRGEQSLDEAKTRLISATRQYAKRQSTWFRNQLGDDWRRLTLEEAKALVLAAGG